MSASTANIRAELLKSEQYLTHEDAVVAERMSVGPLGNYQTQEEKNFDTSYRIECKDAKISFSLRRPTSYPEWTKDFDAAVTKIDALQEKTAQGTASRSWFLEKSPDHSTLRFSRNLWEKKDFFPEGSDNEETEMEDDDDFKTRKKNALKKAGVTANYAIPSRFAETFETVAEDFDIDVPPVFLPNGKLVSSSQLPVRLPNALVEVMFSLRHYLITEKKRASTRSFRPNNGNRNTNTFTATIEQVKILKSTIDTRKNLNKKMLIVKKDGAKRKERQEDDEDQSQGPSKKIKSADPSNGANWTDNSHIGEESPDM